MYTHGKEPGNLHRCKEHHEADNNDNTRYNEPPPSLTTMMLHEPWEESCFSAFHDEVNSHFRAMKYGARELLHLAFRRKRKVRVGMIGVGLSSVVPRALS